MRIKEATWARNLLLDNQLGLKLIHHRLLTTFETQELRVENEDLALMNFDTTADQVVYFSRKAAKTNQGVADEEAAKLTQKDHKTYSSARETIIWEYQIEHPIMRDTYDVCKLYSEGKLTKLNVAPLRHFCIFFSMDVDGLQQEKRPENVFESFLIFCYGVIFGTQKSKSVRKR